MNGQKNDCKIQQTIYTLTTSFWTGKLISLSMPTIVDK